MPSTAFVDEELHKKLEKLYKNNENIIQEYPEQEFLASCLKVGLTTSDLEDLTYIETMKVLYSFIEKKEKKTNKATQEDIDKFFM